MNTRKKLAKDIVRAKRAHKKNCQTCEHEDARFRLFKTMVHARPDGWRRLKAAYAEGQLSVDPVTDVEGWEAHDAGIDSMWNAFADMFPGVLITGETDYRAVSRLLKGV